MSTLRFAPLWLAMVAIASCSDDAAMTTAIRPPFVSRFTIGENQNNALSIVVSVATTDADSVRVRYQSPGDTSEVTPFYRSSTAADTKIAIVGLRPSTKYSLIVEAIGHGGQATSGSLSATTGELPQAIRSLRLAGTGRASSGLTLVVPLLPDTTMGADGFVVAFDDAGEIRWYQRFPGAWPIEAKQQPNGHITVFVGRSYGWQPSAGTYVELTPGGEIVRTFAAASGYYTDPHELLLSFHDTNVVAAHLMGYEIRNYDLSAIGGSQQTPLAVHTIERHNARGRGGLPLERRQHVHPRRLAPSESARGGPRASELTRHRSGRRIRRLVSGNGRDHEDRLERAAPSCGASVGRHNSSKSSTIRCTVSSGSTTSRCWRTDM